ncbi:hypothetical protein J8273_4954 [Carpediemonas membranifera]|uniref:Uncharacterized protein n=1 Tax=Carpediemonas membranifera TaxID=201153 RepID=A0A8J6DY95_9EUKA|nr:hypothetical protein J8273_6904 [Carpediemonas membranifera]KAG9393485.1 hypothetical protein J8273_4954 [Carpediemonas membranifera]|eukprot:KAG9391809.1 hypothetical protein J8273_6904 [Carpediemonas membranifera]
MPEESENAATIKEMQDAIEQLKKQLEETTKIAQPTSNLSSMVKMLSDESLINWKRPASNTMKEEAEFIEEMYRGFKFRRLSGFAILARLYLRHRVLWVKDRYGYLAGQSVSTAGRAALAEKPEMTESEIETLVLRTLSKNPRLTEKPGKDFRKRGGQGPKRPGNNRS